MSASDIAVSVRGLSKAYTIAHNLEKHITLAETILSRIKNPFKRTQTETFWALQDVSFDIKKGEVVGIIGRNGAGKSTLLKTLSRITQPTEGSIELWGRVGSLLEVGTGFHPELTGRENIFLNGAILGMRKSEITKQFDAIVDFAGVEKFLDTPVKRYSSGMYVRLAFSVAAHLNPEILIVDEVLAVGDAEFQKKCMGKMKDVSSSGGKTVLFVSHNIAAISSLCDKCIMLANGKVVIAGDSRDVIARYMNESEVAGRVVFDTTKGSSPLVIKSCSVLNTAGEVAGNVSVNDPFTLQLKLLCRAAVPASEVTLRIDNATGQPIFSTNLSDNHAETGGGLAKFNPGEHTFEIPVPGHFLAPDRYSVSIGVHCPNVEVYDMQPNALGFTVEELGSNMSRYQGEKYGMILVNFPWKKMDAELNERPEIAI